MDLKLNLTPVAGVVHPRHTPLAVSLAGVVASLLGIIGVLGAMTGAGLFVYALTSDPGHSFAPKTIPAVSAFAAGGMFSASLLCLALATIVSNVAAARAHLMQLLVLTVCRDGMSKEVVAPDSKT
jgi:hypothetical protein